MRPAISKYTCDPLRAVEDAFRSRQEEAPSRCGPTMGAGLYFRGPSHMMFAALNAGAAVVRRDTLFADAFRKEIRAVSWDVFPGGQQFVMQRFANEGRVDPIVILNWPALARRRAAATR
ncbi:MAG: hypothetical protein ACT4OZ_15990 [Gemmatimonadota bacterium]